MAKPERRLEVWTSTDNRKEQHYFLKDGNMHGYQDGEYLFGVNPKYFDEARIARILEILDSSPVYQKLNFGDLE